METDEIFSRSSGDQGNTSKVAAYVIMKIGGDAFAESIHLLAGDEAAALDDEHRDEKG